MTAGWTRPTVVPSSSGGLDSVSCTGPSFCVAVGSQDSDILVYNGTAWSADENGNIEQPTSVSCPTRRFCAVVDGGGDAVTYDGTEWGRVLQIDNGGDGLNAVSCASASYCVTTDNLSRYLAYRNGAWSDPSTAGADLYGLACPTSSCCAADANGDATDTYAGATWTAPDVIDPSEGGPVTVSCTSSRYCLAMDESADSLTFDGTRWTAPSAAETGYAYGVTGVSCVSASFCAASTNDAVDDHSNLLTFDAKRSSQTYENSGYMAVSCAAPAFCVEGGFNTYAVQRAHGSSTISAPAHYDLSGLSCAATGHCVGVSYEGGVATFDGKTWSAFTTIDPAKQRTALALSCPGSAFCAAVDADGTALVMHGPTLAKLAVIDAYGGGLTSVSYCFFDVLRRRGRRRTGDDLRRRVVDGSGEARGEGHRSGVGVLPDDVVLRRREPLRRRRHRHVRALLET